MNYNQSKESDKKVKISEKLNIVGRHILEASRDELYLTMRFLDVSLNALSYEMNLSTFYVGTDGDFIYFNPKFLISQYQQDSVFINRAYFHMVLHCIFKHLWMREGRKEEYWNLACDIAVESMVDSFSHRAISRMISQEREECYDWLKKNLKVLTAEGIYKMLWNQPMAEELFERLAKEFLVDDHSFWEAEKRKGQEIEENNEEKTQQKETQDNQENLKENQNTEKKQNQEEQQSQEKQQSQEEQQSQEKQRKQKEQQKQEEQQSQEEQQKQENQQSQKKQQNRKDQSWINKTNMESAFQKREERKGRWQHISESTKINLETFSKQAGEEGNELISYLSIELRERYDYRDFLKRFAVWKEEMKTDEDSFDLNYYTFGLNIYGNMPFIEPLEYRETRQIEEFVIVIDTSGSCPSELVERFLAETYAILRDSETFSKKRKIHLLQCDTKVQSDDIITSEEELKGYMKQVKVSGAGGTDFRPAFEYVADLQKQGQLKLLRGLLYFTDGYGIFPETRPAFETAFVLFREDYSDVTIPPWAIKLILGIQELEEL